MSDNFHYTFPSPLAGYESREPLPNDRDEDGKSYVNPPNPEGKSKAYEKFVDPIDNGRRGGFDVHIYFNANNDKEKKFAEELWKRIRYEFPELRIYQLWDKPIGPHITAMFEVNLFNPAQFGAFVPWLVINRGPLSALVHPNTGDDIRDHTQLATWMGKEVPVDTGLLKDLIEKFRAPQGARATA